MVYRIRGIEINESLKNIDSMVQEKNIYYKDLIKGKILKTLEIKKLKGTFNSYMKTIGN